MAQKIYHVFISSTYSDLKDERRKVSEAVAKAGYVPEGMELFPASSQKQFEFIKRVIDRCDYYVVIIGGRYGTLADGSISYTEKEYEYALSKGIPTLAFLHRNPESLAASKTDASNPDFVAKLVAFRKKLSEGAMVDFWDNPADLATSVVVSVGQEITINPGIGWVRGDQAMDPSVFEDLAASRDRVVELERQLANSITEEITFPRHIAPISSEITIVCDVEHYEQPGEEKEYKIVKTDVGLKIETTWEEAFLAIQSHIHKRTNERRLSMELPEQLALTRKLDSHSSSAPSFNIYVLKNPGIEKFRHQFEALGLVYSEFTDKVPSNGPKVSDYVWNLTDKGRQFVAQAFAEKA